MLKLPDKPNTPDFVVGIVKDGDYYALPLTGMSKNASATGMKLEARAFNHGSLVTGFNKVSGRNIEISTYIEARDEAGYLTQLRELKNYVYMGDYRLYVSKNRYFNIKGVGKFTAKDYAGFAYRRADIDITFLAADPFEYTGYEARTVVNAADGQTFKVHNDCNIDVPLIVNITPVVSAPSIVLENATYNRKLTYKDPSLANPAMLTVDTEAGTVTVEGGNRINNFSGAFLSLKPGANIFTYLGADVRIEFIYKERFI